MSHRTVRLALRHTLRHTLTGAALIAALVLAGPARAQDADTGETSTASAEASFLELAWDWLTAWIAPISVSPDVQADGSDAGWIIDPDG